MVQASLPVGGLYWRFHPQGRPFTPENAHSTPIDEMWEDMRQDGYSCLEDPWHLVVYAANMGWLTAGGPSKAWENDIIGFSGKPTGEVGHDREPLVIPDMRTVKRYSFSEFEREVIGTPFPSMPNYYGGSFSWERFAQGIMESEGITWRSGDPAEPLIRHIIKSWGPMKLASRTAIGPNDPIYRALRDVKIPYEESEGYLSGQEVANRAIALLRSEGYGPEKPGEWWFVNQDEGPGFGLSGAKYWAGSFGYPHMGKSSVGFIYEARFTERPDLPLGNSSHIPGRKITIVAVHVTDTNDQWQRVELPTPIQTTASDKGLLEGAGVTIAGSLRTDASANTVFDEIIDGNRYTIRQMVWAGDIVFDLFVHDGPEVEGGSSYDIGSLVLKQGPGGLYVHDIRVDYKREGWGTLLFQTAQRALGPIGHSDPIDMTPAGLEWSKSVGRVPQSGEQSGSFYNPLYSSRTGALDNEARISVAEQVMERAGLSGEVILVPVGHVDDPSYQAAIQPLVQWVRDLCRNSQMRFYASDYILNTEGGGAQALTDGMNKIVVRPITNTMTVLHEVAHVLNRSSEGRGHDDAFIDTLEGLYRKHLGPEAADTFIGLVRPD